MEFYNTQGLADFLNRDVLDEFDKIHSVLKENNLDPDQVLRVLIDISQGNDYANQTVESISKRLGFIATMDSEKTICNHNEDGWFTFGTIHSEKQQYKIKKVEGMWYAKVKLTHSGELGDDIAIQVSDDANVALNKLFNT